MAAGDNLLKVRKTRLQQILPQLVQVFVLLHGADSNYFKFRKIKKEKYFTGLHLSNTTEQRNLSYFSRNWKSGRWQAPAAESPRMKDTTN